MGQLLKEFKRGSRDADSISIITSEHESSTMDDAWNLITRDLEDLGITPEIANQQRAFVVQWFTKAISEGQLAGVLPDTNAAMIPGIPSSEGSQTGKVRSQDTCAYKELQPAEVERDALVYGKRGQALRALKAEVRSLKARIAGVDGPREYEDARQDLHKLSEVEYRLKTLTLDGVICDGCDSSGFDEYFHCETCEGGDFDLCIYCVEAGARCLGIHPLRQKRQRTRALFPNHELPQVCEALNFPMIP
jgi:hypothetical protein